jgi:hypothetical protein
LQDIDMSSDGPNLENDLRQLNATALDEALLERLEACAAGTWTQLDPLEKEFEQRLRGISPTALDAGLLARLETSVAAVPFPTERPTIVHFPLRQKAVRSETGKRWWAAAAAVALFGALAGWLLPQQPGGQPLADTAKEKPPGIQSAAVPASQLVPAGYNCGLSEASDEGVVWHSDRKPHRVLKFVYRDRVTLKDAAGRTYQVEQPRVEYLLVPAKTD